MRSVQAGKDFALLSGEDPEKNTLLLFQPTVLHSVFLNITLNLVFIPALPYWTKKAHAKRLLSWFDRTC